MVPTQTVAAPIETAKYPGTLMAIDGNTAVVLVETAASEAAGSYPISPSSQMGEGFADAMAKGELNAFGRPLIFIEPEGEHAAAGVTAGMSMVGLRACNFSSGQGVAYMHESLYAAAGKRLPYVLTLGCRAMTKQSLNVHAGHDDYHGVDDAGFFQLFAKNAQQVADMNLIARRTAELSLTPGLVGMDGWLTSHVLETVRVPERELIREYLGSPEDEIDCPTAAQRMVFGAKRRRVPRLWDTDNPAQVGVVQNQDSYAQGVAAQRPFFFDHVEALGRQAMQQYGALTGRRYDFVMPYRCEDAEYVLVGQGSMAENAEAVVDYLREKRGLKVGVVQVVWFRPFPGAQLAEVLKGRKGVAVLERTDQPLAVDLPLVRETRAALSKAQENGRALSEGPDRAVPHRGYPAIRSLNEVPRIYSGCYGLGSRDLQPSQIIGAVENMLEGAPRRAFFYTGVEFVQKNPPSPERKKQQDKVLEDYPNLADLSVEGSENPSLLPENAIAFRLHSIGGWGAITTGKNLGGTMFDLLGLHLKCNPRYGGEKKGAPTTYYGAFARERIRVNCELHAIDVVLSPDPNVFQHTDALHGLREGGAIVIQTATGSDPASVWRQFPPRARKTIAQKNIEVYYIDAFGIAKKESSNPDLELRMQGTVFQGAFFRVSPVLQTYGLDDARLFKAVEGVLDSKFGSKGRAVVEDNLRVVRRGFEETKKLDWKALGEVAPNPPRPPRAPLVVQQGSPATQTPLTRPDRFFEQVGKFYTEGTGDDGLADPFAAFSFTPAVTGTFRDMTQIRFEYPKFIAENCTGCSKCWTQCPDSAIPGLVVKLPDLLRTASKRMGKEGGNGEGGALAKVAPKVEAAWRNKLKAIKEHANPAECAREAVLEVAKTEEPALAAALAVEAEKLKAILTDLPMGKTKPFFDAMEKKGQGGLLAITVNPEACKGCMECVEVCGDGALIRTPQDEPAVAALRRGWETWLDLPDTDPSYIKINDLDKASGVLPSLLLAKKAYYATVGGDGACMGCGEKTPIHLLCSVADALMQPRVHAYVQKLDELKKKLDEVLSSGNGNGGNGADARRSRLEKAREGIEDLAWRYKKGPTGRGRTAMGMVNSTGCTTVWGSTYPYNPYPFPWANHLFQDAPSVAMGVFEGHARQMADGFKAVRIAELELSGQYDPKKHDRKLALFDWKEFTDDELLMMPPVIVLGGDGAMLDIGFQNLSRMLISGRPIKVLVVDTQVYSNTGGQVCTSGFIGQISDMATYGEHQKGKVEPRKEIGLMAIAHRGVYTAQTSQAHPNHMLKAFIEGMVSKRPALFSCYTTCQPEHGVADDASARQAKLVLEGRGFPFFVYDPDKGPTIKDRMSLTGNPALGDDWPTYKLAFTNEKGEKEIKTLPMTFADFAASEGRFMKHFSSVKEGTPEETLVPFHDFLKLGKEARKGKVPFIWATRKDGKLRRLVTSLALVTSAEERLDFWHLLQDLAGLLPAKAAPAPAAAPAAPKA